MSLIRTHIDVHAYGDGNHPSTAFVETSHPPLPAQVALTALRTRVMDRSAEPGEPTRWWHRDNTPWAAVVDLHKAGGHEHATTLAELLRWCETWPWDKASIWTVTETLAAAEPVAESAEIPGQVSMDDLLAGESL